MRARPGGAPSRIEHGKTQADAAIAESLFNRARGYTHEATKIFMPAGAEAPVYAPYTEHYPPDTHAASLWLRNRSLPNGATGSRST